MGVTAALSALTAVAGIASSAMAMKTANDEKKAAERQAVNTPTYNEAAENKKAALQEAEANKKRIMTETDTVRTTALGNTGTTETKKKTLLGG